MRTNWPNPLTPASKASDGVLIHLLGDIHFGAINEARTDKVRNDILYGTCPTPTVRVQVGDLVDAVQVDTQDLSHQNSDVRGLAWLASLGGTYYVAIGNHDILTGTSSRTGTQAAAAFGMPGLNYSVDLGSVVLLFIGPDTEQVDNTTVLDGTTTLTWLGAAAAATTKDCIVVCHAPLYNTVLGDTSIYNSSTAAGFWAVGTYGDPNSAALTAVLAAHSNIKGYISGHTHSPLAAPGLMTTVSLGGRNVAHINCSSIYYTKKAIYWNDPMISPYLIYSPSLRTFEIRWRDHAKGVWTGPSGVKVTTLTAT